MKGTEHIARHRVSSLITVIASTRWDNGIDYIPSQLPYTLLDFLNVSHIFETEEHAYDQKTIMPKQGRGPTEPTCRFVKQKDLRLSYAIL